MSDLQIAPPVAGYQGENGAFSEQAARALLGEIETRGYRTFAAVADALEAGHVAYAVLPFENSLHGPIAEVRELLASRDRLAISGEAEVRIEQCLIGMPGAQVEAIDSVASHPVALAQCRRFLSAHPHWLVCETHDTAGAVREMTELARPQSAAIGPAAAAERYGAAILQRGIQDDAENLTRFWLIRVREEHVV
jgi:prephenate dehydratase